MVGAPLASLVNREIEKRKPELKQTPHNKSILPNENRLWNRSNTSDHNGYKSGYPDIDQGLSWATAPNGQPAIFYPGQEADKYIQ